MQRLVLEAAGNQIHPKADQTSSLPISDTHALFNLLTGTVPPVNFPRKAPATQLSFTETMAMKQIRYTSEIQAAVYQFAYNLTSETPLHSFGNHFHSFLTNGPLQSDRLVTKAESSAPNAGGAAKEVIRPVLGPLAPGPEAVRKMFTSFEKNIDFRLYRLGDNLEAVKEDELFRIVRLQLHV